MKSSKSKRRQTTRASSRDPLNVQIAVKARLPRGSKIAPSLINDAIQYRIEHGEDHPRFETKIIRWQNPTRRGSFSSWRQGNQSDAWATLAKWIRFARVETISVRRGASRRGKA